MFKEILFAVVALALVGCSAHIREDKFITQDEAVTNYKPIDIEKWQLAFPKHNVEQLNIVTKAHSATLHGLLLDNPDSQDVIIFIPGNGQKISKSGEKAFNRLVKLGTDIVFFDRRGLGASDGQATIENLISDSIEKLEFVRDRLHPDAVIVHGYSLGSFIAGQLAKLEKIDALVLEGTATNVDDWIDSSMPWYVKPFLTVEVDEAFNAVDNKVVVSKFYTGPLLIIGGENDDQVPVELSSLLFNSSNSVNKKLMIVENADHGSMLDNPKEIMAYKQFLDSIKRDKEARSH